MRFPQPIKDFINRPAYSADIWVKSVPCYCIFLGLLAFSSAKNIPLIFALVAVGLWLFSDSAALERLMSSRFAEKLALAGILIGVLGLFSPIDICLRPDRSFEVRMLPVIIQTDNYQQSRDFEAAGKQLNQDYVVYGRYSVFNQVKHAIVVSGPIEF